MRASVQPLPGFEGTVQAESTGREADYYATPRAALDAVLPYLLARVPPQPGRGVVLEVGIGHGAVAWALADAGYHVRGVDVRPEAVAEVEAEARRRAAARERGTVVAVQGDAEVWTPAEAGWTAPVLAAVGNPPFWAEGRRLMGWLDRLLAWAPIVVQLLPTRFLHTDEKASWHRAHPCDLVVLDERPRFVAGGGKDECCWMIWPPVGPRGQVFRAGETPTGGGNVPCPGCLEVIPAVWDGEGECPGHHRSCPERGNPPGAWQRRKA